MGSTSSLLSRHQVEDFRVISFESLLAMPDGGLLIGFRNAGVAFLKNEKVTTYADASGMERATVRKLALALDGTVWAATSTQ
jgi:hypothetical protein